MEVQKIGSRGILFNLPSDPFTVQIYCITSPNYLFIIDSGVVLENQMEEVKKYLEEKNLLTKPVILFNTHGHLDHMGGNEIIESEFIIAHYYSNEEFQATIDLLGKYDAYKPAVEKIVFPNITFKDRLNFIDEGVEFFYAPGHTKDSACCYDSIDKVLLIGDLLVHPLPSINWPHLDVFIETLENLKKIEFNKMILGHEKVLEDTKFLDESIEYLKRFKNLDVDFTDFTNVHGLMYRWGMVNIAKNLRKEGRDEEAKKFLLKIKSEINSPFIKPEDEGELKGILSQIEEGLKD